MTAPLPGRRPAHSSADTSRAGTVRPGASDNARPTAEEPSLGQLIGEVTEDLQRLLRQEIALAKAEIRAEAGKAGKAAGLLGGAGFAGYMVAVLLSLAAVFGLANVMDLGWAALIIAGAWAIAGGVLYAAGRQRLRTVTPKPERTIDTLKEDAEWVRHPTE
jgi:hypothetical protein